MLSFHLVYGFLCCAKLFGLIRFHLFICLFFIFLIISTFNYYLFICLCWVFVSVWGLPLVAASGGHSSSQCAGLSLSRPLLLRSTGSRHAGSVIVAHGPSCSVACGILPDQGSNPCPLHWQVDSQPLRHQGSPHLFIFVFIFIILGGASKRSCCDLCQRVFFRCFPLRVLECPALHLGL